MNDILRTLPSDDDVRRLLAASRTSPDPRISAAISLALSNGLTLAGLMRLAWRDIDRAVSEASGQ